MNPYRLTQIPANIPLIIIVITTLILSSCGGIQKSESAPESPDYAAVIDSLSSSKFRAGDTIAIYGKGFGEKRNAGTIVFGSVPAEKSAYLFWSDSLVILTVPEKAEAGNIFLNNQGSEGLPYEIEQPFFIRMISFFVKISLGITIIFIYLKINKIWKRKHDPEVADSQSLAGLSIYILNCVLWVVKYGIEGDLESLIDTSVYILEGSVFFLIGTGLFVRGRNQTGFWALVKRALKLERTEADYLLKKFFKPKNADKIIEILHQLAMIDEELDPKEKELIESFAKEWNIDYSAEKMNKGRKAGSEYNFVQLRKSLGDYLDYEPPREQAAQLRDMMTALINVDEKISDEEELINSELMGILGAYLNEIEDSRLHHVLIVPQQPEHEAIIKDTFPDAKKIVVSGGTAYSIGSYYSMKYADMICRERRKINMFTIVHSPE